MNCPAVCETTSQVEDSAEDIEGQGINLGEVARCHGRRFLESQAGLMFSTLVWSTLIWRLTLSK